MNLRYLFLRNFLPDIQVKRHLPAKKGVERFLSDSWGIHFLSILKQWVPTGHLCTKWFFVPKRSKIWLIENHQKILTKKPVFSPNAMFGKSAILDFSTQQLLDAKNKSEKESLLNDCIRGRAVETSWKYCSETCLTLEKNVTCCRVWSLTLNIVLKERTSTRRTFRFF